MRTRMPWIIAIALTLMPAALWAERPVNESISASPDALVQIENIAGWIKVVGADQATVEVTGTLGDDVEDLEIYKSGNEIYIEVEIDDNSSRNITEGEAKLEITVPRGASLEISTVSAPIEVRDVTGTAELESVSGSVTVAGEPEAIEAETVSGAIEISAPGAAVEAESVSGSVVLTGVVGRVEVSTVSGSIEVSGERLQESDFESVSGEITFRGSLASGAEMNVEAHSSNIELHLPADVSAYFEIETFSGRIENSFGPPAQRVDQYTPEQSLEFRTGTGDAEISIETFSGNVSLSKM